MKSDLLSTGPRLTEGVGESRCGPVNGLVPQHASERALVVRLVALVAVVAAAVAASRASEPELVPGVEARCVQLHSRPPDCPAESEDLPVGN